MSTIHPAREESASSPDGKDASVLGACPRVEEQGRTIDVLDRALEAGELSFDDLHNVVDLESKQQNMNDEYIAQRYKLHTHAPVTSIIDPPLGGSTRVA